MNKELALITSNKNPLIGNQIHTLDKYISRMHNENLKEYGITLAQALILFHIYQANISNIDIFQKDIESALGLTNPTITSAIKVLVSKELVTRKKSKKDGRYFSLHLTDKSKKIVLDSLNTILEGDKKITSALSDDEMTTFLFLLNKIIPNDIK